MYDVEKSDASRIAQCKGGERERRISQSGKTSIHGNLFHFFRRDCLYLW